MCGITGWVAFDRDLTREQPHSQAIVTHRRLMTTNRTCWA